jgi:tetratricopeptide (TPR) repeat protein
MELSRRASYSLLRYTWMEDPSVEVQSWQVEDYRSLPDEEIFSRLENLGFSLSHDVFLNASYPFDSPEDFSDHITEGKSISERSRDQIFLLIFELWRRFTPEKLSLSIFCDELDRQIALFDKGELESDESVQDVITHLQAILDENIDDGAKPTEVFKVVCANCYHNLEDFLYDYILLQMELGNESYATELAEGFKIYLKGSKWFELLQIRLLALSNVEDALEQLKKVIHKALKEDDFEFNLDILAFMAQVGDEKEFVKLVKKTIPLLEIEEDFQDLLIICKDYYHFLDRDEKEQEIKEILEERHGLPMIQFLEKNDADIPALIKII